MVRAHPTVPLQRNLLWLQYRVDRPDVFARAKYKRALQMAFRMAALVRSTKSGEYTARKGIPKDVREAYARLYGPRWEALFKLPAGTPTT